MSGDGTGRLPLENGRDVLARVGFRYLYVTVGYFALVWLLGIDPWSPRSPSQAFPGTFLALTLPLGAGIADWYRLRRRRS